VSKALLKSSPMTTTYGLVARKSEIDYNNAVRAAVVDPVGWNIYWSLKLRTTGGVKSAGYRNLLTTTRSKVLHGLYLRPGFYSRPAS